MRSVQTETHMNASRLASLARTAAASMILASLATTVSADSMFALLEGSVSSTTDIAAPIVVVVLKRDGGQVAQRVFLESNHSFRMPLVPGSYKFYAFVDADRNGVRGAEEPISKLYSLSTQLRANEVVELPTMTIGN